MSILGIVSKNFTRKLEELKIQGKNEILDNISQTGKNNDEITNILKRIAAILCPVKAVQKHTDNKKGM